MTQPTQPTLAQVLEALDAAAQDETVASGWRGMLRRLHECAGHLAGVEAVRQATPPLHDEIPDDPCVRLGLFETQGTVIALWRRHAYAYARRAQCAVDVLAGAAVLPEDFLTLFPGESASHLQVEDTDSPVEVHFPDELAAWDGAGLILEALAGLNYAEEARRELDELEEFEDPDTGETRYVIAEQDIDQAHELEDDAGQWDDHLASYAQAVAYTLATTWRPRLAAPSTSTPETVR